MEKGTAVAAKVTFQDRVTALTRGVVVVLGQYARAGSFLQELQRVRQLMFAYAARYQRFTRDIPEAMKASIDQDFVDFAKWVGDVAAAIKSLYPNGPPMLGQSVPESIVVAGISKDSLS